MVSLNYFQVVISNNSILSIKMAEEYLRDELDRIKKNQLLTRIGCSVGPKKKQIYLIGMFY